MTGIHPLVAWMVERSKYEASKGKLLATLDIRFGSQAYGAATHSKDISERMALIKVRAHNMIKQVVKQVIATGRS